MVVVCELYSTCMLLYKHVQAYCYLVHVHVRVHVLFLCSQDPSATIGRGCRIGPSVVIGPDVVIEDGTYTYM